jgi:hypothetical protein
VHSQVCLDSPVYVGARPDVDIVCSEGTGFGLFICTCLLSMMYTVIGLLASGTNRELVRKVLAALNAFIHCWVGEFVIIIISLDGHTEKGWLVLHGGGRGERRGWRCLAVDMCVLIFVQICLCRNDPPGILCFIGRGWLLLYNG